MKLYIISYFVTDDTQFNLAFGCKVQKMQVETDKEKAEEVLSYYRSKSKFFAVDLHEVEVPIITTASGFELIDEKVMNVWDNENVEKRQRVVFGKKNGNYLAWNNAKTIEQAKEKKYTYSWENAEEIKLERVNTEPKEIIEIDGIKYKKI